MRKHSIGATLALVSAVVAALLLVSAGPMYRAGVLPLGPAFTLIRWSAYLGLAAAAAGLIALFTGAGRGRAAVALVIGVLVFAIPFQWQRRAQSVPRIHDISTDTVDPPAFDAIVPLRAQAPNALDYSTDVAAQQKAGYPDIGPLTLPLAPPAAFERALEVAREEGWEIVAADPSTNRIEATDTTLFFGFKDDIVIRLTPQGAGTRIDVRSVSRVGRSDVGTNARRIRRYLDAVRPS